MSVVSECGGGKQWTQLWLVLKRKVIHIYKDQTEIDDVYIGCLTINEKSSIKIQKGDREGYRFELNTLGPRRNKFRTKKKVEREKWRAYITGLATGRVPNDLDLLNHDIDNIKEEIRRIEDTFTSGSSRVSTNPSVDTADSGISDKDSRGSHTGSRGSSSNSRGSTLDDGGPVRRHNFYPDDHISGSTRVPSWFFADCTRPVAEKILLSGVEFGNTLMRESTSHSQSGSYVISKLSNRETEQFEHYEVVRTAQGYKVRVENEHTAMKCLNHVMEYFVRTSGRAETIPMTSNNRALYGEDLPDYNSFIPSKNYDDDHHPGGRQPEATRTVNAAYMQRNNRYQGDPSVGHHTVGAAPRRQGTQVKVSIGEIVQMGHEAAGLQALDRVISDFEDPIYYNNPDEVEQLKKPPTSPPPVSQTPKPVSPITPTPAPPPPPPAPHQSYRAPNYGNDNRESFPSDLATLPPAPPPPPPQVPGNHPVRPSSDLNLNSLRKNLTQASNSSVTSPRPVSMTTTSKQPIKHSVSFGALETSAPGRHMLRKTQTASSFDTAAANRMTSSERSFEVSADSDRTSSRRVDAPSVQAGIDDTNPGGVGTLRNKFSQLTGNSRPSVTQLRPIPTNTTFRKDPGFMNKLEGILGQTGSPNQTSMGPRSLGGSVTSDPDLEEDRVYQEIPPIQPDEVFYVNERFNQ